MTMSNRHFYCFGSFRLSATEGVLRRDLEPVSLGPKAVETLLVLLRNRQRVVSREELMKAVWPDSAVEENNLDQQITALRRALGQGQNSQIFIETIPRRGYGFFRRSPKNGRSPARPREHAFG
jgi:DNA-binding winged helix-turn-helix (wHTH) protein